MIGNRSFDIKHAILQAKLITLPALDFCSSVPLSETQGYKNNKILIIALLIKIFNLPVQFEGTSYHVEIFLGDVELRHDILLFPLTRCSLCTLY